MVYNQIDDSVTFEIDITNILKEVEMVIIKIIKNNKTIQIKHYKRRNNYVKKRGINEN